MLPAVDVKLHPFPSADRAFAAYAEESFHALDADALTPAELQRRIRRRYPAAAVVAQDELARHGGGPIVWYVYRSGSATAERGTLPPGSWPAWALIDDDRRFVDMSAEFAAIAEVPASDMIGRRVEEFSNPDDPTIREDLLALWEMFEQTGLLASTIRFNYADGTAREVEYRLVANDPEPGRHRLSIRELGEAA